MRFYLDLHSLALRVSVSASNWRLSLLISCPIVIGVLEQTAQN